MTKAFEQKVIDSGFLDTRRYRYLVIYVGVYYEIRRLPIKCLGTSAAYRDWELVKRAPVRERNG